MIFRKALNNSSTNHSPKANDRVSPRKGQVSWMRLTMISKNKPKCDFGLFFIFNNLSVVENGGTSLRRGISEFFRGSLDPITLFLQ